MGKGCINHNERKFIAKNVDPDRTGDNIVYCNEDIKEALVRMEKAFGKKANGKISLSVDINPTTT